jgi:hypothetical protein
MSPAAAIIGLVIRIVGVSVCSKKAKELNRSPELWGFFGFLTPILAMIWIQFKKPILKFEEHSDLNHL